MAESMVESVCKEKGRKGWIVGLLPNREEMSRRCVSYGAKWLNVMPQPPTYPGI